MKSIQARTIYCCFNNSFVITVLH